MSPNGVRWQTDDYCVGVPNANDRGDAQNPESGRDLFEVRLVSGETKHNHHSENAENWHKPLVITIQGCKGEFPNVVRRPYGSARTAISR